jgi:hypothetical protein
LITFLPEPILTRAYSMALTLINFNSHMKLFRELFYSVFYLFAPKASPDEDEAPDTTEVILCGAILIIIIFFIFVTTHRQTDRSNEPKSLKITSETVYSANGSAGI